VYGTPPLTVQFTDLSTGNPLTWRWNFGDGATAAIKNPVHTYGGIGRYTVTLEVKNRDSSDITRKITYVKTSSH
jgi:PKD repeat protein